MWVLEFKTTVVVGGDWACAMLKSVCRVNIGWQLSINFKTRAFNQRRFSEKPMEQWGGEPWAEKQTWLTIKPSSESKEELGIEPLAEEVFCLFACFNSKWKQVTKRHSLCSGEVAERGCTTSTVFAACLEQNTSRIDALAHLPDFPPVVCSSAARPNGGRLASFPSIRSGGCEGMRPT